MLAMEVDAEVEQEEEEEEKAKSEKRFNQRGYFLTEPIYQDCHLVNNLSHTATPRSNISPWIHYLHIIATLLFSAANQRIRFF